MTFSFRHSALALLSAFALQGCLTDGDSDATMRSPQAEVTPSSSSAFGTGIEIGGDIAPDVNLSSSSFGTGSELVETETGSGSTGGSDFEGTWALSETDPEYGTFETVVMTLSNGRMRYELDFTSEGMNEQISVTANYEDLGDGLVWLSNIRVSGEPGSEEDLMYFEVSGNQLTFISTAGFMGDGSSMGAGEWVTFPGSGDYTVYQLAEDGTMISEEYYDDVLDYTNSFGEWSVQGSNLYLDGDTYEFKRSVTLQGQRILVYVETNSEFDEPVFTRQ